MLEVLHGDARFIVKAGGPRDHHIGREIEAHLSWLGPWVGRGRAPVLVHHDVDANLLVTTYLPGRLVLDSVEQDDPAVFRQAGELLAMLHEQDGVVDEDHELRDNERSLRWLAGPHRIAPEVVRQLGLTSAGGRHRRRRSSRRTGTGSHATGSSTRAWSASSTSAGLRCGPR